MWWVIIILPEPQIVRFDQAKLWKVCLVPARIVEKFVNIKISGNIVGLTLMLEHRCLRDIVEIDLPVHAAII